MRISVDYNEQAQQSITIISAKYVGDFVIKIQFNDGTEQQVDFKPFLRKSRHPSIKKYLDETLFTKYQIIDGNLNWNDYDLIFPVWELYSGEIGC